MSTSLPLSTCRGRRGCKTELSTVASSEHSSSWVDDNKHRSTGATVEPLHGRSGPNPPGEASSALVGYPSKTSRGWARVRWHTGCQGKRFQSEGGDGEEVRTSAFLLRTRPQAQCIFSVAMWLTGLFPGSSTERTVLHSVSTKKVIISSRSLTYLTTLTTFHDPLRHTNSRPVKTYVDTLHGYDRHTDHINPKTVCLAECPQTTLPHLVLTLGPLPESGPFGAAAQNRPAFGISADPTWSEAKQSPRAPVPNASSFCRRGQGAETAELVLRRSQQKFWPLPERPTRMLQLHSAGACGSRPNRSMLLLAQRREPERSYELNLTPRASGIPVVWARLLESRMLGVSAPTGVSQLCRGALVAAAVTHPAKHNKWLGRAALFFRARDTLSIELMTW